MKILKKNIILIMLFGLVSNFFVFPITNIYAEESREVKEYIYSIDENIVNLQKAISIAKLGTDYIDNSSYKYGVLKVEEEINEVIEDYNSEKNNLGNSVSLEKLLIDSNSSYLEDYNNFFTEDKIISFDNIENIIYNNGEVDKTITKEELTNLINETYFKHHFYKIEDFSNNYATYISNYQSLYEEENKVNNEISSTSENESEVTNEDSSTIKNKRSLQNIPSATSFEENVDTKDTLIQEIEELKTKYASFEENELKNTYTINNLDYDNPDYTIVNGFINTQIQSFITTFENGIALDNEYQTLKTKVSEFLNNNPDESSNIYTADLDAYYDRLDKANMLDRYSKIVSNSDITDEDIVDTLLKFTSLDKESSEYEYLYNAKLVFYPLSLHDESLYTIEIKNNYLIIKGSDNILKTDFFNNINYINFELNGTNTIIDGSYNINLRDRNDNLLRTLNLVIKNDVNKDGLIDNKDINTLKSKILKNEFDEYDYIASDINNDNVINIVDLTMLDTIVNNKKLEGETTKASFNIVATRDENKIIYDIYLNTDGIVSGFEFNINTSSNLKLLSITSNEGVFYQKSDEIVRAIGLGSYEDRSLLMTITYENLSNENSSFTISDGLFVYDNLEIVENISATKSVPSEVISQSADTVNSEKIVNNTISTNANDVSFLSNNTPENSSEDISQDDDNQLERKSAISGEELDNNEVVWGNIIKIALIVLLGALIIYLLNKDNKEEEKDNNK